MQRSLATVAGVVLLAVAAAACGGGGTTPGASPAQHQSIASVSGRATLVIPARSSSSSSTRRAQFVSASAVSVGIAINGGAAVFSDVSATSSLCTASSGGRTCTIPLTAPAGNDTFVLTLYDGANGAGNVLGTSTASQSIVASTPFTLAFAAAGLVASVTVTVPPIDVGPTSVPVTVTAKDADGNTIVGPNPYASPIALANSDTTGTLTLSTTTVKTPNDVVLLTYSGSSLATPAAITPSLAGLPASALTAASVMPLNYFPVGLSRTYAQTKSTAVTSVNLSSPGPTSSFPPSTTTNSFTQSVSGAATFNGLSNLHETIGDGAVFSNYEEAGSPGALASQYQSVVNGSVYNVGGTYADAEGTDTITFLPGYQLYAPVPFVTAASPTTAIEYTGIETYLDSTYPQSQTYGRDASNTFTSSYAYADGSTYLEVDKNDGSGSVTETPGTGTCYLNWDNGLPCAASIATELVAAPSGGSIAVTANTTTAGSVATSTVSIPTAALYPNGVPTATSSATETVGAPLSAPPAPCAVTASYTGPVIPVTSATSFWYPTGMTLYHTTEVDYLAPGIGPICVTYQSTVFTAYFDYLGVPPPLTPPAYANMSVTTETDSLTSVGPPLQNGTIVTTGRSRSPAGARAHASFRPWAPLPHIVQPRNVR